MKIRDIVRPLLQEIYQPDGWKMLVCCIMLNLTNRKQVDRVRHKLFKKYPTAKDLSVADYEELSELLTPLGMQFKRAATLMKFSKEYNDGFTDPIELYGIGKYAKDSWEIFQNNNIQYTDLKLKFWLKTIIYHTYIFLDISLFLRLT